MSFQLFLGGPKIFLFFNATGLLKNWKKQHFICSNLTLFIVPFFFYFFSSSFFSLFSFFLSSFFFLFPWGATAASLPQMTPLQLCPWLQVVLTFLNRITSYTACPASFFLDNSYKELYAVLDLYQMKWGLVRLHQHPFQATIFFTQCVSLQFLSSATLSTACWSFQTGKIITENLKCVNFEAIREQETLQSDDWNVLLLIIKSFINKKSTCLQPYSFSNQIIFRPSLRHFSVITVESIFWNIL